MRYTIWFFYSIIMCLWHNYGMLIDYFETPPEKYEQSDQALIACGDSPRAPEETKSGNVDLIFADPPYNIGRISAKAGGKSG